MVQARTVWAVAERLAPYPELGAAVARARKAAHLSREDLGRVSGTNLVPSFLSYIERGEKRPSPENLAALCRVLRLDFNEMSALAGYTARQYGDATVRVPREKAVNVGRFALLPASWQRRLLDFAEGFLQEVPRVQEGEEGKGDAAQDEGDQHEA